MAEMDREQYEEIVEREQEWEDLRSFSPVVQDHWHNDHDADPDNDPVPVNNAVGPVKGWGTCITPKPNTVKAVVLSLLSSC